jgi:hypothetical protein
MTIFSSKPIKALISLWKRLPLSPWLTTSATLLVIKTA